MTDKKHLVCIFFFLLQCLLQRVTRGRIFISPLSLRRSSFSLHTYRTFASVSRGSGDPQCDAREENPDLFNRGLIMAERSRVYFHEIS